MKAIRTRNQGAALVEFAIVAMLLITLVFGIIEFGLIIKDYLTLSQAAREGARSAALGSPTSVVTTRVQNSAPTLTGTQITVNLYKRTMTGGAGSWAALGNTADGLYNNALPGDQVRVSLSYPHTMVTGSLFSWVVGGTTKTVTSEMVWRRE